MKKFAQVVLAIADLYVSSSNFEGFSISLIEAMAMGLPVVATDVGVSRWLFAEKDNECGLIVSPGDSPAISEAIINLLKNPQRRKRMGLNGQAKIEKNFTLEKRIKKIETLFDTE